MTDPTTPEKKPEPWLRLALELGPLLLFFLAFWKFDMFAATAVFMVAIVIAMAVSYALMRRISPMSIVSAFIVLVFGGLTLWLHDETFIKMKPTIIYGLFGGLLLGGLLFGRSLLAHVFDSLFEIDAEGWRKLTMRWGVFFLVLALINEVVWRTMSTSFWVSFKVFGFLPLIFVFGMLQASVLERHALPEKAKGEKS